MAKKKATPETDRQWLAYCDHLRGIRAGTVFNPALEAALCGAESPQKAPRPRPHPDHRGDFFGAAMAPWAFGQRLILADPDAPEGGLSADMMADMGRELLARSLGAIRVDEGTTEAEVVAAYRAIQLYKDARREALGLVDPPKEGSKRDVGDWWPGVEPGSVYHRRLSAIYLERRAKVTTVVEIDPDDPRIPAKLSQRPPTLLEIHRVLWPDDDLLRRLEHAKEWDETGRDPGNPKKLREQLDRAVRDLLKAAEADLAKLDETDDPTPWTPPPGCYWTP